MRARIWKLFDAMSESYWFIPLLMALGAIAMSVIMVALDRIEGLNWLGRIPWLYANHPSGARALLQTIAGSMITVAGVTFSITIAAVANTSAQFGPRLMTNFMNDRGNQITFGTFVATFLYCLLILRTVRGGDDLSAADVFVPNFAILGGLFMALASLGVLIYFIHHIPESIHISEMTASVGRRLMSRIDALYPSPMREDTPNESGERAEIKSLNLPTEDVQAVYPSTTGFVQRVDRKHLSRVAQSNDVVLWVVKSAGDFASPGTPLVLAKPAGPVSEGVSADIRAAFVLGLRRTPSQDVLFLVNQLVEVAARALSPGVNDPFTATSCIDWLAAALGQLAGRATLSPYELDKSGNVIVTATQVDFERVADAIFSQLRPYVQADRNASAHTLRTMMELLAQLRTDEQRAIVLRHCEALRDGCMADLSHPRDQEMIDRMFADVASRWGHGTADRPAEAPSGG